MSPRTSPLLSHRFNSCQDRECAPDHTKARIQRDGKCYTSSPPLLVGIPDLRFQALGNMRRSISRLPHWPQHLCLQRQLTTTIEETSRSGGQNPQTRTTADTKSRIFKGTPLILDGPLTSSPYLAISRKVLKSPGFHVHNKLVITIL